MKLTLQFVPFDEIASLDSGERIKKLLKIVLEGKIILLQGKLKVEEEARLIEDTMAIIGHVKDFKGIELEVLNPKEEKLKNLNLKNFPDFFKSRVSKLLLGERDAITIIGPASIVKEVKKDPRKLELMLGKK